MFGIGTTEFLIILVVAILVLGPEHLPRIVRTMGKVMSDFRRVSTEFQRTINLEASQEEWQRQQEEDRKKKRKKKAAPASDTAGEPAVTVAAPAEESSTMPESPAPADELAADMPVSSSSPVAAAAEPDATTKKDASGPGAEG